MVVAYRSDPIVKPFKHSLSRINSFVLPNLITGTNEIPEFLDGDSTPPTWRQRSACCSSDTPERRAQIAAFARLDALMALERAHRAASPPTSCSRRARRGADGARDQTGSAPPVQRRLETGT